MRPAGCPFLENGACCIYELRPFACRAYGLWGPKFGKVRTQKSRLDRKAVLGKFAVIKEIVQQGTEKRLEQMLDKATPHLLGDSSHKH